MSAERSINNLTKMQNPMFVHPSEGPGSFDLKIKLIDFSSYRSWRRAMEIALSTKRKVPFVRGPLARLANDLVKGDEWNACNNLVIA